MRRAAAREASRRAERMLLWLYRAVSGYGLRARRALAWALVVAALSIAGRYLNIAVRILGPILLGLALLAICDQAKR